jgi:hypothetical protein
VSYPLYWTMYQSNLYQTLESRMSSTSHSSRLSWASGRTGAGSLRAVRVVDSWSILHLILQTILEIDFGQNGGRIEPRSDRPNRNFDSWCNSCWDSGLNKLKFVAHLWRNFWSDSTAAYRVLWRLSDQNLKRIARNNWQPGENHKIRKEDAHTVSNFVMKLKVCDEQGPESESL